MTMDMGGSNKDSQYDVVIAGAGPAGAQCARELATRGYDVVVLETESEEEFPAGSDKSTGGTFRAMLRRFDVPDDVVMQFTDELVLESPSDYYRREYPGAVLDFAAFKRFLVEDGREAGAAYRFGARVSNPIMEGDEIVGVEYDGEREADGEREVYGEVVIDATGPSAPLARALGVSDLERRNHAIGIEYEFEGVDVMNPYYPDLTDSMMLRLDNEHAPGGYAWIFHTGGDTAKVGVCYLDAEGHERYGAGGRSLEEYLERWLEDDPRLRDAERKEGIVRHGSAHVQSPGSMCTDNFLAIGDTVPTVDALWGEGIYKCLRSARVAADVVDNCLSADRPDTSAAALSAYDGRWHEEVAPDATARLRAARFVHRMSDERADALVGDLNRHGYETLTAASKGDRRAMAKLVHPRDLPLLANIALDQFRSSRAVRRLSRERSAPRPLSFGRANK